MGIFGQLPNAITSGQCINEAVTTRRAKGPMCPPVTVTLKDCRPEWLVACVDLQPFRVSECGETEFLVITEGNPDVCEWICQDCCIEDFAEVKAIFTDAGFIGFFAKLSDGRVVKWNDTTHVFDEIECEPATHQDCIRCVTTGSTPAGVPPVDVASFFVAHKIKLSDWTTDRTGDVC